MIEKVFYLLAFLTLLSALMVVISKHPIQSILYLVLTFFLISAHYVLMNAQFLALINVVVYAGAIMVLFLFVVMFLNLNQEIENRKVWWLWLAAVVSGGCILLMVVGAIGQSSLPELNRNLHYDHGLIENIGVVLYRDYLFPMELSSILFLVAMVGVVLLSRREKRISSKIIVP